MKQLIAVFVVMFFASYSFAQIRVVSPDEIKKKEQKEEEQKQPEAPQQEQQKAPPQQQQKPETKPVVTKTKYNPPLNWLSAYFTYSGYSRPLLDGSGITLEATVLKDWDYAYSGNAFGGGIIYSSGKYSGSDTVKNKFSGNSTAIGGFLQWVTYNDDPTFSAFSLKLGGKQVTDRTESTTSAGTWKQNQVTAMLFGSAYTDIWTSEDNILSTVSGWVSYERPVGDPSIVASFTDSVGNARNVTSEAFDKETISAGINVTAFTLPIGKGGLKLNGLGQGIIQKVSDVKRVILGGSAGVSLFFQKLPILTIMAGLISRPDNEAWKRMYATFSATFDVGHMIEGIRNLAKKNKKNKK